MIKPIAILIFSGTKFGGAERRFARLASHLIENGKDAQLFCTFDAIQAINEINIKFSEYNYCGKRSIVLIDNKSTGNVLLDKINRLIGVVRFAFLHRKKSVHVHLAMNPGLVPTIISFFDIQYSISIVDYHVRFNRFFLKRSVSNAAAVECLSNDIREKLILKSKSFSLPDVLVSPCSFTDTERAVCDAADASSSTRDIDVTLIARQVPGKGHELLQEALRSLPDVSYYMEPTDDPFGVMGRSKIFLSLQAEENYPSQALLEAMISGCAIVATDVGETRKLLDESCAILIPYDAEALVKAILNLLSDAEKRREMAKAARQKVLSEHTIERFANYFIQLCDR